MKYVNEFGINPNRGNSEAAGIDFYIPDASTWGKNEILAFYDYISEKHYTEMLNLDDIKSPTDYNKYLMYFSHMFEDKDEMEFGEWEYKYWDENNHQLRLCPLQSVVIPSGIRILLSPDTAGIFLNKSGIGIKGLIVKAQVIDKDYTGYVHCNLANVSESDVYIRCGQKITQLLEIPVIYTQPQSISKAEYDIIMAGSQRGSGMAGSTGIYNYSVRP